MAKEVLDAQIFEGDIQQGDSETLRVKSQRADAVGYFADDNTFGNEPPLYDAIISIEHVDEIGNPDTKFDEVVRSTSTSYEVFAHGKFMEVEFININDTVQTYRFILQAYRQVSQ